MDADLFRWVLVIIAVVLALAIYLFGQHQARLRKRSAVETFTREEVDSTFVEDEQLRSELSNLNKILEDNGLEEKLDEILDAISSNHSSRDSAPEVPPTSKGRNSAPEAPPS